MFQCSGQVKHVPGNVPANVPGKTLAPQGFSAKWNIGTFIFYIRVKERI
jgi:hypothetical protein